MTLISGFLRYWTYLECVHRAKADLRARYPDADMSTFKLTNWSIEPPAHRWYPRAVAIDLVLTALVIGICKVVG